MSIYSRSRRGSNSAGLRHVSGLRLPRGGGYGDCDSGHDGGYGGYDDGGGELGTGIVAGAEASRGCLGMVKGMGRGALKKKNGGGGGVCDGCG